MNKMKEKFQMSLGGWPLPMRTEWGGQVHLLYLPFRQALAIAVDLRSERLRHLFDFFRNCKQCQMPNLVARRANPMYDMLCMD